MIRCSLGTAKVLGLKDIKVDSPPTTAYLMVGERCRMNCSFCAQARESTARADMLSRVTWPGFNGEAVLDRLSGAPDVLQRVCFQVVHDPEALRATKDWVVKLREQSKLPVCVSAGPRSLAEVAEILSLGVDHVSIALDAATPAAYAHCNKGGSWEQRYDLLREAATTFPGHIATHLIVGLGESEEEMIRLLQKMYDHGITVALFAFTPVRGTQMEPVSPPDMLHYRKVQVAQYLIKYGYAPANHFTFRDGKLTGCGMTARELADLLKDGEAFRTSGCTGCNRPYYNEIPGREPYNFPRPLTVGEAARAWELVRGALEFSYMIEKG